MSKSPSDWDCHRALSRKTCPAPSPISPRGWVVISDPSSVGGAPDAHAIAADWVARELARKLSVKEQSELAAWLQENDAHQVAYDDAWSAYEAAGDAASHSEVLE